MADRVAVLRGGELQQFDTPQQVYANPANLFVAVFIGSPAMNIVEGELGHVEDGIECHIGAIHPDPRSDPRRRALSFALRSVDPSRSVFDRKRSPSPPLTKTAFTARSLVSEKLGPEVISHVEVEAT